MIPLFLRQDRQHVEGKIIGGGIVAEAALGFVIDDLTHAGAQKRVFLLRVGIVPGVKDGVDLIL